MPTKKYNDNKKITIHKKNENLDLKIKKLRKEIKDLKQIITDKNIEAT